MNEPEAPFSIHFTQRDFDQLPDTSLDWQVQRLSWKAMGGPEQAELSVVLPGGGLSRASPGWALERLRQPISIHARNGEPVWWGFVRRVEIASGALACAFDLQGTSSRVAVQYGLLQPGLASSAEKKLTPWEEDGHARAAYGKKERILFLPAMLESQALAARDTWLNTYAMPTGQAAVHPPLADASGRVEVRLVCRGWWETLDWVHAPFRTEREGFLQSAQLVQRLGSGGTDAHIAQSFSTQDGPWWLSNVLVDGRLLGLCVDSLRMELCSDSSGVPGSSLAGVEVPAAYLGGGRREIRFHLDSPLLIQAQTPYWIKLSRTGAPDALNACQVYYEDSNPYPRGQMKLWDGSGWVSLASGAADMAFNLEGVQPVRERLEELAGSELGGQFLNGVHLCASLSGWTPLWKEGYSTCLNEILELLQGGSAESCRLLGCITPERVLEISAVDGETDSQYVLDVDGSLVHLNGSPVSLAEHLAGQTARAAPGWLDQDLWMQSVEWTPEGGLRVG